MAEEQNPLHASFQDPVFLQQFPLNPENVLDYFSNRANPFYESTCNNQLIKMQGQHMSNLTQMEGVEYGLIHHQDPILYIIQKRRRTQTPNGPVVTPLAHYHIINGTVYQAPDLASIMNSRLSTALDKVLNAFQDVQSASRYNPTKGYWWEFKNHKADPKKMQDEEEALSKVATTFQKNRVDFLLQKLLDSHPYMYFQTQPNKEPIKLNQPVKSEPKQPVEKTPRRIKSENEQPQAKRPRMQ